MNKCSIELINKVADIASSTLPVGIKVIRLSDALNKDDNVPRLATAFVILSNMPADIVKDAAAIILSKINNDKDFESYLQGLGKAYLSVDKFSMIKGLGSLENFISTVHNRVNPNAVMPVAENILSEAAVESVAADRVNILGTVLGDVTSTVINDEESDFIKKKAKRILLSKDVSKDSPSQWANFLAVYFPGINEFSIEFTNHVKDEILNPLIDFKNKGGFMENVDEAMLQVRRDLEITENANRKDPTRQIEMGKPLSEQFADPSNGEAIKKAYFNKVLLAELDFLIDSIAKVVTVSRELTKKNNSIVEGLIDSDTLVGRTITADISSISPLFMIESDNVVSSKAQMYISDSDLSIDEFLRADKLQPNSIYYLTQYRKFYYVELDPEGKIHKVDITAVSHYEINAKNNRNFSSIDNEQNPLDQGTAFINNFFNLLKTVKKSKNGLVYGDRMDIRDYLRLAPLLLNTKRTYAGLRARLSEIVDGNLGRLSEVAASLLYHIFDTKKFGNKIGSDYISSLIQIDATKDSFVNGDIVASLFSALTSKRYERYSMLENGRIRLTKELTLKNDSFIINDELHGYLMHKDTTMPKIAKHIRVDDNNTGGVEKKGGVGKAKHSNQTIFIVPSLTSPNTAYQLDRLIDINTVMSLAENLSIGPLMKKIQEHHQSIYPTQQAAEASTIGMFKKIVTISAANMKDGHYNVSHIDNNISNHIGFKRLMPTVLIYSDNDVESMIDIFTPDRTKNITVAGVKRQSLAVPNRNAFIPEQVETYKSTHQTRIDNSYSFLPFLNDDAATELGYDVPSAKYNDYFTKAPIYKDGKA